MATYLTRISKAPSTDHLSQDDLLFIDKNFDVTPQEVTLKGVSVAWDNVNEIEVAKAARSSSPAGWFVRKIVYNGAERYHIAIYFGRNETVLPNITLPIVQHILQTIAYYAPKRIAYTGAADITQTTEAE